MNVKWMWNKNSETKKLKYGIFREFINEKKRGKESIG